MSLNPPDQYATDAKLRARQQLWQHQQPHFDITAWVLEVAELHPPRDQRVLDVGCGNGVYLKELHRRGLDAIGCDRSPGMLAAAEPHRPLVNADVTALPFAGASFDIILAAHMLYHVDDRRTAVTELRRVLAPGGRCVVVTNGAEHLRALRRLVETAVRSATPGWEMRNPSTHAFSLENGEQQLRVAFDHVDRSRPIDVGPVVITDAAIAADYVASVGDHYQAETARPWHQIVEAVRRAVQREIDTTGEFVVRGHSGAFICR